MPSGTPPKPAPRPGKKDSRKESREEPKDENKEKEPEVKKEVQPEAKEDVKQEVLKNGKPKETKEIPSETKLSEKREELDGKVEKVEKVEEKEKPEEVTEKGVVDDRKETHKEDKKEVNTEGNEEKPSERAQEQTEKVDQKVQDVNSELEKVDSAKMEEEVKEKDNSGSAVVKDDLWVARESGKEALRPGGRSMSLKVQRTTSGTEKTAMRSATLPKPWSPGQAPSNMLSRKLSWDRANAGEEDGRRTKRSASSSDEGIPEVSEDQISKS